MDNKKKTRLVVIIGSIILSVLALVTTTYSLFYNEQVAVNPEDYSTGLLSIEAKAKSDTISLDGAIPMSDEDGADTDPYIFTIKNNGNVDYKFDIKLLSTSGTTINPQYIKVKIDDNDATTLASLTNSVIKSNVTLAAKESVDMSLRIWLDINTPNTEIGKTFTSKIVTEGQAVYTESNYDAYDMDIKTLLSGKGYVQIEYLESTGEQYIDTEFKPNQDSRMWLDYQPTIAQSKIYAGCRGNGSSTTASPYFTINSGDNESKMYAAYGTSNNQNVSIMTTNRITTEIGKNGLYFNDELKYTPTYSEWQQTQSIFLFAVHQKNTASLYSNVKIYELKIWNNDILIVDMIPCYHNTDNKLGMYNIVNDKFYVNSGTGEFIAGPEV